MLNTRYLDYVPAMSRRGGVACLSGRTAAYRRSVITPLMPALEHEIFLGRECVAGDDGRLTWLVLAAGYRTVYQASAQADSMFPDSWAAFVRQRVRWSRNSYRCYLTALAQGWLWRQPLITQVTVLQILVTPLTMAAAVYYTAAWAVSGGPIAVGAALGWAVIGRGLRGLSHLRENPRDLAIVPLMALVVAGIALPIKVWAAVTMNRQGWLTRTDSGRVQGQGEVTVSAPPAAPQRRWCAMPAKARTIRATLSGRRLLVALALACSCRAPLGWPRSPTMRPSPPRRRPPCSTRRCPKPPTASRWPSSTAASPRPAWRKR